MEYFLGIDPGKNGALSLISKDKGRLKIVWQEVNDENAEGVFGQISFAKALAYGGPLKAVLEEVRGRGGPNAKWGASQTFEFGRHYAFLEMALVALSIAYVKVQPQVWMRVMHKGVHGDFDTKARSLVVVKRAFSDEEFKESKRARKAHDGLVDATALALYGAEKCK